MPENADIKIEGLSENLTDDECRSLVGAVVHIPVGGTIPPEGVSWFDLFRFARVLSVTPRSQCHSCHCPICKTKYARFKIEVEWEAGYQFPDGNILCENCVDGVVKRGHQHIAFGDSKQL